MAGHVTRSLHPARHAKALGSRAVHAGTVPDLSIAPSFSSGENKVAW